MQYESLTPFVYYPFTFILSESHLDLSHSNPIEENLWRKCFSRARRA
jgi:hypothetical protein